VRLFVDALHLRLSLVCSFSGLPGAVTRALLAEKKSNDRGEEKKCSDCQRIVADRQRSSLRSNKQRCVYVLWVRQAPVLLHVAA
jgi:hypothetical protein